jgi:hypothetical protein
VSISDELFLLAHNEFAGTDPSNAIAALEEAIMIAPDQWSRMLAENFQFGILKTYLHGGFGRL